MAYCKRCPDCDDTGFLGDQCAGVAGNTEFHPCDCGIVNQPYVDLAEMTHQAHRNQGLLESIWNVIYPKSNYEYLGQISAHTVQILQEHKGVIADLKTQLYQAKAEWTEEKKRVREAEEAEAQAKAQVAEKDRVIKVLAEKLYILGNGAWDSIEDVTNWAEEKAKEANGE